MAGTLPKRKPPKPSGPSAGNNRPALVAVGVTASILAAFAIGVLVGRAQRTPPSESPTQQPKLQAGPETATAPTPAKGMEIEMQRPDGTKAKVQTQTPKVEEPKKQPASDGREQPTIPTPQDVKRKPDPTKTATVPKAVPQTGKYTVQVAAFRDRVSAERLSLKLESRGYDAYVQKSKIEGKGIWYRVRVGSFNDKDTGRELAVRIKKQEGRSAYVTLR